MELVAGWELINYRVTFKNDDGTVLEVVDNAHYGETVTYSGETPIKPNPEDDDQLSLSEKITYHFPTANKTVAF